jgi:uncharacterized protein YraI
MTRKILILTLLLAALAVVAVQPAAAQIAVVWRGDYFDSIDLSGTPEMSRDDSSINFNWGEGSPGIDVQADTFSVRWGTDVYLNAGTYRFTARADDGIRIWVDYGRNPIVDTWWQNRAGETITVDVTLQSGTHHIQVDYMENTGQAYVSLDFGPVGQVVNPPPNQQPGGNGIPVALSAWTAQYWANANLSGSPSLIQSEPAISRDWENGSPTPSIPPDNWSARWTSLQTLGGGTYQITVRADDGVRVFVDGVAYINEWHASSGQTYTASLTLGAGQHSFTVDFFELSGLAFLEFDLDQIVVSQPPVIVPNVPEQPQSPTFGATATITASRLNVRAEPNPFTGQIVAIVSRNQSFPILGYNLDGSWVQLNVGGITGWVNRSYVRVSGGSTFQPTITPPQEQLPPVASNQSGFSVMATPSAVYMRSGPGTQYPSIAVLPRNATAPILARSLDNNWWLVEYGGVRGWVSAFYARIQQVGADVSSIPVSG